MTDTKVERTLVLLSMQRALQDEVFPALRAVTVEWSDSAVRFTAYVDGDPSDEDTDSMSVVSAELAADFSSDVDINYDVVRLDYPAPIPPGGGTFVFARRES